MRFLGAMLDLRPGHKLLGSPSLKVRLGLAGGAVLILGSLLAPQGAPPVLAVPDERAAPLLGDQGVRVGSPQLFGGLEGVARDVARFGIAIPRATDTRPAVVRDYSAPGTHLASPAGFGVLVSADGDVLTHDTALDGRAEARVQTANGGVETAKVRAYEPSTGLTLLRIPPVAAVPAVPPFAPRADPGALVVAVGPWEGRVVALPAFVSSVGPDAYTISVPDGSVPPGAPVYDADGRLLAIATGGERPGRAFPVGEALARLSALAHSGQGNPPSIGAALQSLDETLAGVFSRQGALVSAVVPGGPADAAGLEPGDVVVAVDDTPVDSADGVLLALAALTPGSKAVLEVSRQGRARMLPVTAASAMAVAAIARSAAPEETDRFPEARTLWTGQQLREANIAPAARVLRVGDQAVTSPAQARRMLARSRPPIVLYMSHDGQRFFTSIRTRP